MIFILPTIPIISPKHKTLEGTFFCRELKVCEVWESRKMTFSAAGCFLNMLLSFDLQRVWTSSGCQTGSDATHEPVSRKTNPLLSSWQLYDSCICSCQYCIVHSTPSPPFCWRFFIWKKCKALATFSLVYSNYLLYFGYYYDCCFILLSY